MALTQLHSTAPEDQIRAQVTASLAQRGATVESDGPGSLVMNIGSVGMAYLAGGLRNRMKMPMRISLALTAGPGGSAVSIEIKSRGSGGGLASGGLLGASKQKKAEAEWLQVVTDAVPGNVVIVPVDTAPPPPGMPPPPPPPPPG